MNLPTESEVRDYTTKEYLLSDYSKYPPLGLLAIAADVNPRHELDVVDVVARRMSIDETVNYVLEARPDMLGLSVVTRRLYAMREIIRRVKESLPGVITVAGGPHINYWPEETMEFEAMDYALAGYGERAFPSLVETLDGGGGALADIPGLYYRHPDGKIAGNPLEEIPTVLDPLPFPNRRLIDLNDYSTAIDKRQMTTMYSSRGCPFRCIYCDVQEKRYHYRSAKSVVDEFEEIIGLGIKEIHIFDDTFNVRRQRVLDICEDIKRRGLKVKWSSRARVAPFDREMMRALKSAGCERLHIGVESLDPATLKYMNKKQTLEQIEHFFGLCREFKIETLAYLIIGFPNETEEYRQNLLEKAKSLGITYAFCNILYPLPKTEYYRSLLADGTFPQDYWNSFMKNPVGNYELPLPRAQREQEELERLADDFHRRFCLRPGFIYREFKKSLLSPRQFSNKAKLALSLMTNK